MSDKPNNVSLIFDAKKDKAINYSWCHYAEYPEMKKYLVNEKTEHGYRLRDTRTHNIIMQASFSLERYLK